MLGGLLALLVLVGAVQGRLADYGDSRTHPQYDDDIQRDYNTARDRDDLGDSPQETPSDFDYKYEEESQGSTKLPDREVYDIKTSPKSKLHNPSYVDSDSDVDSYNSYEDVLLKSRKSRPRGKPKADSNDDDGADVEIKLNRYNNYPNDDRDQGYSGKRKLPCPRVKYVNIESKIECQPGKTYDNRQSRKKHRPRLKATDTAHERRKSHRQRFKDERHKYKGPPEEKDGLRMELDEEAVERILVEENAKGGDDNGKPDRRPLVKERCNDPELTSAKDNKNTKEEEEDHQYYDMKILFRIKDRFPGLKKAKLEAKALAHSTVKPNESDDDVEVILGNYRDRKKSDNQFQQQEANTNATLSLLAQGAVEPGMQEEWKAFLASFNFSPKTLQVSTCTILLAILNCLQIYNQLFSLSIY